MDENTLATLVEDARFDFTMDDFDGALEKLERAVAGHSGCSEAWLTLAEVKLALRALDEALEAAKKAEALAPEDVHAQTTLSRIWVELGDKEKAEYHGAQARMLGWKEELRHPPTDASTEG